MIPPSALFGQTLVHLEIMIAVSSIIRGPFITALGRTWCPGHFMCSQATCGKSLQESGFVEEQGNFFGRILGSADANKLERFSQLYRVGTIDN